MNSKIPFALLGCSYALLLPHLASAAIRSDIIAEIEVDPSATTLVIADGTPVNSTIKYGKVVLEQADPNCDPRVAPPCSYTLKQLAVEITNFTFDGKNLTDGIFITPEPVTVVDDGGGIVLPAGARMDFAVTVSGDRAGGSGSVVAPVLLQIDLARQQLTLAGSFEGALEGHNLVAVVGARGLSPFVNVPPVLTIQKTTQTLECNPVPTIATVTDATPPPDDLVFPPSWSVDGVNQGIGLSGAVSLTPGQHLVQADVQDYFGALDTDSFTVNVLADDVPPVFTFVPPAITTSSCGGLQIGQATATDNCRDVTVTNDAPAHFGAGTTVVTWTARDAKGNVSTATQTVTASLKDDASCCPTGSHIILGTPNNDHLVGTSGADCILGFGGQDVIDGGAGNDAISGGDGDDVITGGGGDDLIWGGSGQDQLSGGDGNDLLSGDDGDDTLSGDAGVDTILGGQGQDKLHGGAGNDIENGGTGDDQLFGEDGDDSLDGAEDNDKCTGGAGFDTLLSCTALDTAESVGPPAFSGDASYQVCSCKQNKCNDCASAETQCMAASGCAQIIQCVQSTANCNLPHECSPLCESGRTQAAINAARQLASCFGGC